MKLKKFNEDFEEDFDFDDEEVDFPPIPEPDKKTDMFILQHRESGLFLYRPNQWKNTFTDDARKAKVYTSLGMVIKSISHSIPSRLRSERGKWIIIKLEDVVLGDKRELEL